MKLSTTLFTKVKNFGIGCISFYCSLSIN